MHNPHIDIIHHLSLFHNPSPAPRKPPPATPSGKSPAKVIGAKHRQAHRHESAGAGRAPHIVSVGINAGVAIRGDPLVGRSLLGYLGPGQIRELFPSDAPGAPLIFSGVSGARRRRPCPNGGVHRPAKPNLHPLGPPIRYRRSLDPPQPASDPRTADGLERVVPVRGIAYGCRAVHLHATTCQEREERG